MRSATAAVDRRERTARPYGVERTDAGVRLSGRLETPDGPQIVASIRRLTDDVKAVEIELGDVEEIDPGVVALLGADLRTRAVTFHLHGGERFHPLFELCTEPVPIALRAHRFERLPYQVGRRTAAGVLAIERIFGFFGELAC